MGQRRPCLLDTVWSRQISDLQSPFSSTSRPQSRVWSCSSFRRSVVCMSHASSGDLSYRVLKDRTICHVLHTNHIRFVSHFCVTGCKISSHWRSESCSLHPPSVRGGAPGAVVKYACFESRTWRVWTPLWPSSFKETKFIFPAYS